MGRVTENNGVLIMAKGTELSQGLIYDAWRGAGRPYWINVGEDHYRWKIRYDAASIARGVGLAHIDRATVDWSASRENDIPPE